MSCDCDNKMVTRTCVRCDKEWSEEMGHFEYLCKRDMCEIHTDNSHLHFDGISDPLCEECSKEWTTEVRDFWDTEIKFIKK